MPARRMNSGVTSSGSPNQNAITSSLPMPALATSRIFEERRALTPGRAEGRPKSIWVPGKGRHFGIPPTLTALGSYTKLFGKYTKERDDAGGRLTGHEAQDSGCRARPAGRAGVHGGHATQDRQSRRGAPEPPDLLLPDPQRIAQGARRAFHRIH